MNSMIDCNFMYLLCFCKHAFAEVTTADMNILTCLSYGSCEFIKTKILHLHISHVLNFLVMPSDSSHFDVNCSVLYENEILTKDENHFHYHLVFYTIINVISPPKFIEIKEYL